MGCTQGTPTSNNNNTTTSSKPTENGKQNGDPVKPDNLDVSLC